jgi:hypothetical protein
MTISLSLTPGEELGEEDMEAGMGRRLRLKVQPRECTFGYPTAAGKKRTTVE